jgi:putative methyltransferase (TIGR04325 family)
MYETFEAAAADAVVASNGVAVGYDVPAAAGLYRDLLAGVQAKDYPAMFWLREALAGATTLFDLGGHVGLSYYGFRRYLPLDDDLAWIVCDMPSVVREGEALASARQAPGLRFTTNHSAMPRAEVLLASGSLQYLAEPLPALLRRADARPRHVVVNQMPTHPTRTFVTLQNIGVGLCPYRVSAIDALPDALAPLGYALVDRWNDPARTTAVPYHPETVPIEYTGYYFRRR